MKRPLFALALLLYAAPLHAQRPLPPLPDSIRSQIGWVQVRVVAGLKCGPLGEAMGCYDGGRHVIAITDSLSPRMAWYTLFHEEVHMVLWIAGQHLSDGEVEERVADAIAAHRLAAVLATLATLPPLPDQPKAP